MSILGMKHAAARPPTAHRMVRSIMRFRIAVSPELVQGTAQAVGHEEVVGNAGDLFSLLPCALQFAELAFEGGELGVFVERHLERQPLYRVESEQSGRPFAARETSTSSASAPELHISPAAET